MIKTGRAERKEIKRGTDTDEPFPTLLDLPSLAMVCALESGGAYVNVPIRICKAIEKQ